MAFQKKISERYLSLDLPELLKKKIVLLSGPRQVGKTTLAKSLYSDAAYYNYDIRRDFKVFREQEWDRTKKLVIFDEIHKMKKWKLWLKGLYDEGILSQQQALVTGSARLDIAKKMGDSLAGRFFGVRLNPLDLKELKKLGIGSLQENYRRLIEYGGFMEPFFEGTSKFYGLWSKSHLDLIIRQDLISTENVRDIDGIELLVELISRRVGSTVSFNSLREEMDRDDKTIKRWLSLLENIFVIFRVGPYGRSIARGLKKASKYYFYDTARVQGDESVRFENMVALALKKEIEYQEDINGVRGNLYFAQTKEKKEMDFVVEQKGVVRNLIEAKLSDGQVSANFHLFSQVFPKAKQIQLVRNLDRQYSSKSGVHVHSALDYLAQLKID